MKGLIWCGQLQAGKGSWRTFRHISKNVDALIGSFQSSKGLCKELPSNWLLQHELNRIHSDVTRQTRRKAEERQEHAKLCRQQA